MTDPATADVQEFVLQTVERSGDAVTQDEVVEKAEHNVPRYSASAVSWAIWNLISLGKLGYTSRWTLTAR